MDLPSPFVQDHPTARETRDYARYLSESSLRLEAATVRLILWTQALIGLSVVLAGLTAVLVWRAL